MIWVLFRSKPLWSKRTDAKLLQLLSVSIRSRAVALVSGWFVRTHLRSHETVVWHYENKLTFFPLKIWLLYTVLCQCPMVLPYLDQDSIFRSSVSINQYLGKSKAWLISEFIISKYTYLELILKTKNIFQSYANF